MGLAALSLDGYRQHEASPLTPFPTAPQDFCFAFLIAPLVNTQKEALSLSLLAPDVALILLPLVTSG